MAKDAPVEHHPTTPFVRKITLDVIGSGPEVQFLFHIWQFLECREKELQELEPRLEHTGAASSLQKSVVKRVQHSLPRPFNQNTVIDWLQLGIERHTIKCFVELT